MQHITNAGWAQPNPVEEKLGFDAPAAKLPSTPRLGGKENFLEFSPPRTPVRQPLLIDYAISPGGELVKVHYARHGVLYSCPLANCGEPLFLRRGSGHARAHFCHRRNTACINPSTLHDFAIRWTAKEGGIQGPPTDLIEAGLPADIYTGEVEVESTLSVISGEAKRRVRRADVLIRQPRRVIAVEFVRTHRLDRQKREDYRLLARDFARQGLQFALLVVELSADEACFRTWKDEQWHNYVLFDAPRRWYFIPPAAAPNRAERSPGRPGNGNVISLRASSAVQEPPARINARFFVHPVGFGWRLPAPLTLPPA